MRFLFVSAQLPGHLDWGGYLQTAIELQRRGHDVLWASGREVAPFVTTAKVPFHSLDETGWRWPPPPPLPPTPDLDPGALQQLRAERALDQWLDEARVERACAELIELGRAYQPDLIVSEMFVSAAGLAAEALATPFVIAGWPAMQPKVAAGQEALSALARARLQRLCTRFNLTGSNWTTSGAPALLSPKRLLRPRLPRLPRLLRLLRPPRLTPRPIKRPRKRPPKRRAKKAKKLVN